MLGLSISFFWDSVCQIIFVEFLTINRYASVWSAHCSVKVSISSLNIQNQNAHLTFKHKSIVHALPAC